MRKLRLTERRIALICAIVLITLSVTAAFRQHGWLQPAPAEAPTQANSQPSNTTPSIDSPAANEPASKSEKPAEAPAPEQNEETADTPTEPVPQSVEPPKEQKQEQPITESTPQTSANDKNYTYTAVAGSSYSEFARQAISEYTKAQHLTISAEQSMLAEIDLANKAGSPLLEIGQIVTVSKDAIKQSLGAHSAPTEDAEIPQQPVATTNKECTATVANGDSYSTLARQCIATYLQSHKLDLTHAQRAAAEARVSLEAGQPEVDAGQVITVATDALQQAVSAAQKLDSTQQVIWQPYADSIAW